MRDLTRIVRQAQKLRGRAQTSTVPQIPVIDATGLLDDQSWVEFASADPESRQRMREQQAAIEAALVAEQAAGLPEVTGRGGIVAIIVSCPLPPEEEVWRVTGEASPESDSQEDSPLLAG